jgi:hypothetical protein
VQPSTHVPQFKFPNLNQGIPGEIKGAVQPSPELPAKGAAQAALEGPAKADAYTRPRDPPLPRPALPELEPSASTTNHAAAWLHIAVTATACALVGWFLVHRRRIAVGSRQLIRVVSLPPGEALESIRLAWVGLELPLIPGQHRAEKTIAKGVLSQESAAVPATYAVDGRTAVTILGSVCADTAAWWRKNVPDILAPGYQLLFPENVCERLDLDLPSGRISQTSVLDVIYAAAFVLGGYYLAQGMSQGIWLLIMGGVLWQGFSIGTLFTGTILAVPATVTPPIAVRSFAMVIGVLAFVPIIVGGIRSGGYDLAGPPPDLGSIIRDETEWKLSDAELLVVHGERREKGRMTSEHTAALDIEVLEVPTGTKQAGKIWIRHVFDCQTDSGVEDGKPESALSETYLEPLHRQTLLLRGAGDNWKAELVNAKPTPDQETALKHYSNPFEHCCPPYRVRVGDQWQVDGTRLKSLTGMHESANLDGVLKVVFDGIAWKGQDRCARLKVLMDYKCSHSDKEGRGEELWVRCSGVIYRSLISYIDVETRFDGELSRRETAETEEGKITLTVLGKLTVRATRHRMAH